MNLEDNREFSNAEIQKLISMFSSYADYHYWDITTSVYNILESFYIRVNNYKKNIENNSLLVVEKKNNNGKEIFALYMTSSKGNVVVTPSNLNVANDLNGWVGESTIVQYLKVLFAFGLINSLNGDLKEDSPSKEYLSTKYSFQKDDLDFDDIVDDAMETLISNSKAGGPYARTLVYCIVVTYIAMHMDPDNTITNFRKTNNQTIEITARDILSSMCGYEKFSVYVDQEALDQYDAANKFIRRCLPNEKN